jgi:O-6-methylguanine DNA methyltransferase
MPKAPTIKPSSKLLTSKASSTMKTRKVVVTPYQERVYALLQQIPRGKITSYAAMSRALNSSPRAVGGALRVNPFAPEIPCHRCIAATGVSFFLLIPRHDLYSPVEETFWKISKNETELTEQLSISVASKAIGKKLRRA